MNCEDFLRHIEEVPEREDLKDHLRSCEKCAEEYKLHKLLSTGTEQLESYQPPVSIWGRIEKDILAGSEKKSKTGKWLEKLIGFIFPAGNIFRPVFAGAAAILILISAVYYFKPLSPAEKSRIQAESLADIGKAQEYYLNAIESLTKLAMENERNIEPELFSIYREKLQLLDASIDECKKIIDENELNVNAWNFLFASYNKKVETLREMANYKKDEV